MRVLLFDMMETLIDEPYFRAMERLAPEPERRRLFFQCREREAFLDFELGRISEQEYFRRFYRTEVAAADLALLPTAQRLKKEMFRNLRYRRGVPTLLAELRNTPGVRSGIASNYGPWYREILRRLPALDQVDYLFYSCELGHRKPEQRYYVEIEDSLKRSLSVEQLPIFFADDREENLKPAANLGWKTALVSGDSDEWIQAARQFAGLNEPASRNDSA